MYVFIYSFMCLFGAIYFNLITKRFYIFIFHWSIYPFIWLYIFHLSVYLIADASILFFGGGGGGWLGAGGSYVCYGFNLKMW